MALRYPLGSTRDPLAGTASTPPVPANRPRVWYSPSSGIRQLKAEALPLSA
ncbi:hypothetical protein PGT21_013154 [Puccinia graminis f. sp. tritici]|uniref:Uncharacterized protein n=1 Tax=Puccinia graminis f. sp. tritici TaxID=56615 RepID=A0A5B0PXF0_PUCGR|nr:hypothetical protein PGT21_013154 [Puccinia graminis f. sp. tritici]KAA1125173.1 hypothetical protein PGTUg99_009172 [Puccinia graminis f. sp. tritici]